VLDYQSRAQKESHIMQLTPQPMILCESHSMVKRSSKTLDCLALVVFVLIAALLSLVAPQLFAQSAVEDEALLLSNARIIVGDGSLIEKGSLLLENGIISAVGIEAELSLPSQVREIDLSGKTIIPGLIDAHAHLGYEGYTSWGAENYSSSNLIDHLQRYAYYGFSAVFSAGSDPDELAFAVQAQQNEGEFLAAKFLFAAGVAPPGQGPNDQFLRHALRLEEQTGMAILYGVDSEEQAKNAVREIADKGISIIKIWVDDRGGTQKKLAPSLYKNIILAAKENHIQVFVHQQFANDMPELLSAGVDGFLHGRLGQDLDQELAQQIAQADAFVIPNLGLGELRSETIGNDVFLQSSISVATANRLSLDSAQRTANPARNNNRENELSESFSKLIENGVDIILGTDAGAIPDHFFGYTGHRELEIFVRLGMSPMQALIAATSKPAARLGLDKMGLLKQGYSADMVILNSNPLDDIRNTRSIFSVFLNGELIDRDALAQSFRN